MLNSNLMIQYKVGDIFKSCGTLVNPVNTVGVMGKGLSLQFKEKYPELYQYYLDDFRSKKLVVGSTTGYKINNKWLVNFPTKKHYRDKSKYEYIIDGMVSLVKFIQDNEIDHIAIPPLGCGLGGLNYIKVRDIVINTLDSTIWDRPLFVDMYLPCSADSKIILSIDPSTSNLGWSVGIADNNKYYVLDTGTLNAKKLAIKRKEESRIYNHNVLIQLEIEWFIEELMRIYYPDDIVSEDTFYCSRMPNAFASLNLCINSISRSMYEYTRSMYETNEKPHSRVLATYAPRLVKKISSPKGSSDKKNMSLALEHNDDIVFLDSDHKELVLDREHDVDAVCVGYTHAKFTYFDQKENN